MNENRYVYVSARIRVLEGRLLSEEDFGQLEAASFRQCLRLLAGRGWEPGRDGTDVEGMFGREREKVRRVFQSLGEVREDFRILRIPGEFQRAKAAVKEDFCGMKPPQGEQKDIVWPEDPFMTERVWWRREFPAAVRSQAYDRLPRGMGEAVRQARRSLWEQRDGQLCEIILDRAALEEILREGDRSHIPAVRHYARMTVENADIQIALRGMASGWEMERFRQALAAAGELDPERMARAAAAGSRALETYLENVGFGEAAEAFGESGAGLERWQRERERRLIGQARRDVFSGGLILAYFLQRSREIRLVREMLVEKRGEGSEGGERMRA